MNEVREVGRERSVYLGVAIVGAVLSLFMLYVLYRTVAAHLSPLLILAVALVLFEMVVVSAGAYRRYRWGRSASSVILDRAGRVLPWVVIVLVLQQVWVARHR